MDAKDFGGHTSAVPRLFSIPTLAVGIILLSNFMGQPIFPGTYPNPDDSLLMGSIGTLLGLHGVLTNTSRVGIIRRFLSYASGTAGGVLCWQIAVQLGLF